MQNISLVVNTQPIWLCKKISTTQWAEPVKKRYNLVGADSDSEIAAFGASYVDYLRVRDNATAISIFTAGDRIYYEKKPPEIHNPTQSKVEDANYVVEIRPFGSKNIKTVYFKRIQNR